MTRPAYGFCFPVRLREIRDGDTVVVSFPGSERLWAVRLLDCWAPEVHRGTAEERARGRAATAAARRLLEGAVELALEVPAPADPLRLLEIFTFDRIVGRIWLDAEHSLNGELVRQGFATATKAAG